MQPSCLFCLEPVQKDKLTNPIGCHCQIIAHRSCFEQWFQQKQQMECPICHTVSIPNQVAVDNIRIVFIDTSNTEARQRRFRGHEKAVAFCCCLLMGWGIGLTILDIVYQSRG
jgi:hypothetical protein